MLASIPIRSAACARRSAVGYGRAAVRGASAARATTNRTSGTAG